MKNLPKRMWINAPSTHSVDHSLHGTNVLAVREESIGWYRVYFLSGPIESQRISMYSLSEGWLGLAQMHKLTLISEVNPAVVDSVVEQVLGFKEQTQKRILKHGEWCVLCRWNRWFANLARRWANWIDPEVKS